MAGRRETAPTKAKGSARQPISLRLRPGLRDRLWGATLAEGKTLNETANVLLERGLDANRPLEQVFGSVAGYNVARALLAAGEAVAVRRGSDGGLWLYEPETFDEVAAAIVQMLNTLRPSREQDAPAAIEALAELDAARKRHAQGGGRG